MRHLTVIAFILIVVCHSEVVSQSCLPDGITFTTQSQIDSFPINYPNCTKIEGYVYIDGDDITNLDGLTVLTDIEGSLAIGDITSEGNPILNSLSGLENVTSIGGSLFIYANDVLTSLAGLEGMTSIGGRFWIIANNALTSMAGLESLTSIGFDLHFYNNPALTSLEGLEGLTSIGSNISIHYNPALTSLAGLEGMTSIGGNLSIENNDALIDLNGLSNLKYISSGLGVFDNDTLVSLSGLDSLQSFSHLVLSNNPHLSVCNVESICAYLVNPHGNLEISNNSIGCNSVQEVEEACTASIPEQQSATQLSAYPNPFTTSTTIQYELYKRSNTQYTVYNSIGEVVYQHEDRNMLPGRHKVTWSPGHLPAGLYYAVLRSGDGVSVVKMMKQ